MKFSIQSQTTKTVTITCLFVAAFLIVFLVYITLGKPSERQGDKPNKDNDSSMKDDSTNNPGGPSQSNGNTAPPPTDDKPPANTPPNTDGVCNGSDVKAGEFTLMLPAYVYVTAIDAKNKTNPALVYGAGEYTVYKCYDNIVNITQTPGVPGGWLDPKAPYQSPADPTPSQSSAQPPTPTPHDVMNIDNTAFNWSHEYPKAFVRDYNGLWNIAPNNLYLTFDCGYDYNGLAGSIMDTLKAKDVKAVFFVTGDFMKDRPDLVQRMASEGHAVGNHSYAHLNQPQNLDVSTDTVIADIRAWESAYRAITGANAPVAYFRPPAGAISKRSMALMNQLGYKTLMWGAAYKDWDPSAQPTQGDAMTLLRQYTTSGDIILLHGVSQTSSDVLGGYIDEYRSKGFTFSLP